VAQRDVAEKVVVEPALPSACMLHNGAFDYGKPSTSNLHGCCFTYTVSNSALKEQERSFSQFSRDGIFLSVIPFLKTDTLHRKNCYLRKWRVANVPT